jgi:FAD/FMN-containing dehydrogenase
MIYGGMMVSLPDRAEAILKFAREYMASAPEDLGLGIAFVSAPPQPFVPAEMHFKPIIGMIVCWTGSKEEGERVLAPLREVAQPVMDMVDTIPYTVLQSMLDEGGPYGVKAYMKAEFMPALTDAAIAKLVEHGASRPGPMVQLLLEPLGGAVSKMGEDETALGRRDVAWCFHALSMWMEPDEATATTHVGWAKDLAGDMKPETVDGVYLNFTSDSGEERVRATYGPEKYARLVALKDKYDPHNLFRLNQNIRPSSA